MTKTRLPTKKANRRKTNPGAPPDNSSLRPRASSLERQIAATRRKLMSLWDERGRTDPDVLAAGIEMDELLNEYQKSRDQETGNREQGSYVKGGH